MAFYDRRAGAYEFWLGKEHLSQLRHDNGGHRGMEG